MILSYRLSRGVLFYECSPFLFSDCRGGWRNNPSYYERNPKDTVNFAEEKL